MDNLKEALAYAVKLGIEAEKPEVVEICGKTYCTKELREYGKKPVAEPVRAHTLSSMLDYIAFCSSEFSGNMIIHIVSPKQVRLMSVLDEDRKRETLFISDAETSEFRFDTWFDQERFMIELQANFQNNDDLEAVKKMAGNIDKKNSQQFTDDGITQVATINIGVAAKADALVPNPVELIPFRTFREVEQPKSKFVFRIGDKEEPAFKLIEAEGGIWRNEAIQNIKNYFYEMMEHLDRDVRDKITIIG